MGFRSLDEKFVLSYGNIGDRSQRLNSLFELRVVWINKWALVCENSTALVHNFFVYTKFVVKQLGGCLVPHVWVFGVQTLFKVLFETIINTYKVVGEVWALILAAECDLIHSRDKLIAGSDLGQGCRDRDNKNGHSKWAQSYKEQHTERVVERESESEARVDSAESSKNDIFSWVFFVKIFFQISDTVTLSPWLVEWRLTHIDSIWLLEPFVTRENNGDQEEQCEEAQEPVDAHRNTSQHIFLLHRLCYKDGLIIEARNWDCFQRGTFGEETIEVKWCLTFIGL